MMEVWSGTVRCVETRRLHIQNGTKDGDDKMGEVRCAFIELKPAHNAMISQVFRDPSFRDSQMVGKLRLDGIDAAASRTTT